MCRLWLATSECNYKETDRELKGQYILGLNDSEMLAEINEGAHQNRRK